MKKEAAAASPAQKQLQQSEIPKRALAQPLHHPQMPPLHCFPNSSSPWYTEAMREEDVRIASAAFANSEEHGNNTEENKPKQKRKPLRAIDLSRYQAVDETALPDPEIVTTEEYHDALVRAVETSLTQLSHLKHKERVLNAMSTNNIDAIGSGDNQKSEQNAEKALGSVTVSEGVRNAWLIANYEIEAMLGQLERELANTKKEVDLVNLERKKQQDLVKGEMEVLEREWRDKVGRVLEVEVATEELRREGDRKRRVTGDDRENA